VLEGIGPDGWTETLSEKENGRWAEVVTRRFRKASLQDAGSGSP
jgi:hypothetical protein